MKDYFRKKCLAFILTLALAISFMLAATLTATASTIEPISAEPNTPLELSPSTLAGNVDLNPDTNGYTWYLISFSQPTSGTQNAQLYFVNQNDMTYDAQYTNMETVDAIYFLAQQIGTYTFTITLEDIDMIQPTITRTIYVEVTESNVSPTFVGTTTSLEIDQDAAATDIKGLLHASDSDADQTLTWTQFTAPTHGVLSFVGATAAGGGTDITSGGTITYKPTTGYSGSDSFAVQVSDGTATATRTINVTVNDATAPTVSSVSAPTNATYSIGNNLDYTVNFSENVSVTASPYLTLTIGSSTVQASYISGSGTSALKFRYTVTSGDSDADGVALNSNISLNSGTIKDAANNSATLTFTGGTAAGVLVDGIAPTVSSVSAPTNATYSIGNTLEYTVNFSENVSVTASPYLTLTIGSSTVQASYISGSGTSALKFRYTVVSGDSDADGVALNSNISLNSGTIKDAANNSATLTFTGGTAVGVLVDGVAPTVSSVSPPTNATYGIGNDLDYTVNFSENVTVMGSPYLTLTIGSSTVQASYISGSGTSALKFRYTAVSGDSDTDGVALSSNISLNSGTIKDAANNSATLTFTGGTATGVLVDGVAPTVMITSTAASCTNTSPIPVTITFSESVTGLTADDIMVSNGSKDTLSGSGSSYSINITPSTDGAVTVDIAANVAIDAAGNNNTAASQLSRTYDNTAPTVTISSTASSCTNASPIPVTITFSESVTGFTADDITVANGSKGALSGSGSSYSINITPSAEGEVTVDIAGSVAQDAAGNNNTAASQLSRTYDSTAPTVMITSTAASCTNTSPIPVTITFSESMTGFTANDITVSNGTKGTLSGSGTTYSINITPIAQGAVTVDIAGSAAQDAAGNNNTAASQLSRTYDSTAPTVAITSTAASFTNTSPIPVTITFSESVTGFTADDITVGNGSKGALSGSGSSYSINITPSSDGQVTVDIAGSVAQDAAGNNNISSSQLNRVYDTTAPTVTITSTATSYTNTSPIPVTITFSESVSGFTADDITVANGSKGTLSGSGSSYSINITPSADGEVTVDIAGSVAQDAAGNNNEAASQLSRTYDSVAPTAPTVASAAASTNDSTPEWTWTAGSGGNGTYRYKLDNSTLTSGATETTTASYTPASALSGGSHTLYVQERDQAGNWSTSGSYTITIDSTAPTVAITSTVASFTNTSPIPVTITFSESVTGFTADDITVANGSKGALSGSGSSYSINITPSADGEVTVDIAASIAIDAAGNNNTAASQLSRTYDSTAPTVSITSTVASFTNTSPIPVTITFSESVTGFTADDITVANGSKGALSGSGSSYSINITPSADGEVTVDVAANIAIDIAGNNNTVASQLSRTYDTTAPVAGGTGTITVGTVTTSAASLSWSAATDNLSPQASLQYQVYYSTSNNISTLSDAESNGTAFGGWTANITTTNVTGLTAATEYYFNIIAKDQVGNKSIYTTATATTASARSHRGDSSNQSSSQGSTVVEVNGQKQDAGKVSTRTTGGQTITTVTVDDKKLDNILKQKGNNATVTLNVSTEADIVVGELNGQTVKNMEDKQATLEIQTETVTYTLPASQINIDSLSSQFGSQVDLKEIKVSIKIAESPSDTVKIVKDTANQNNYQIVVQPVEFTITCTSGDKTIEVSRFNSFVERTVAIPEGIDPSKITTGIVLNADKTFRQVPTQIVKINGKYYAKISSLTNSTYSVIYNSVMFTDMADHWAKDAVNDMGARMIVTGTGNNTYEPNRTINRAEFAAIIVRAMGLEQSYTESSFDDVTLTDWFNGYVDTANAYALITGYDSISFGPNDLITREQAMAIIARAMNLTGISQSLTESEINALLAPYTDSAQVSSYARESTAACLKMGIVSGTTASTISPKAYVTRAEVAVLVQRLLQKSALI